MVLWECHWRGHHLCNRHAASVDEEAAILDIPTCLIVRDRLGEELGCVAVEEHASGVSSIVCILLYDGNTLLVTCGCAKRHKPGGTSAAHQLQEQETC